MVPFLNFYREGWVIISSYYGLNHQTYGPQKT